MKYLLLFLLPFSLYASKVLSYNIYERTDRADVMITFDTPYHGVIKQSKSKNRIIIKLEDAQIEASKVKKVNSNFLHSLTITPLRNQIQIVASISPSVKLIASKTSDGYGLRLRFTDKVSKKSNTTTESAYDLSALPTKKDTGLSSSYYIVVAILIFGIGILLYIKKRMQVNIQDKEEKSWLFKENETPKQDKAPSITQTQHNVSSQDTNVSIRFQKAIDSSNSVVMLDFGEESYLVLMGNSNILLDKFRDNKPTTEQEFNTILQERNQELEDFLGTNDRFMPQETKEPLQAYKERAASISYSDEY